MHYFTEIEEGYAILYTAKAGIYRQARLARRDGLIYAKYGSGYVRLHRGGGSSSPSVSWKQIDAGALGYHEEGLSVRVGAPREKVAR